jgi:hypothetical protein
VVVPVAFAPVKMRRGLLQASYFGVYFCKDFIDLHLKIVAQPPLHNSLHQGKENISRCLMVDRCFNPACRRKLRYLRDGRVVRLIRGKSESFSVEHFWLCGPCYHTHDFEFPADGSVGLKARSGDDSGEELLIGDVLLPERRSAKRIPGINRESDLMEKSLSDRGFEI